MIRETYTKPEFDFQKMALFEKVAAKCWGTSEVWLDANRDSQITKGIDIFIETSGGCQGSWSAETMTANINSLNSVLNAFNASNHDYSILARQSQELADWAEARNVQKIDPITATPQANWANTQATSGGGIIIIGS